MNTFKTVFLPVIVLTSVCVIIALLLGVVNGITAEPIAAAEQRAKEAAIYSIYPGADSVKELKDEAAAYEDRQINSVYAVGSGASLLGYAVNVTVGSGYGGEINMTVGVTQQLSVAGVEIVSHSETAGLGARIDEQSFRSRFTGITGEAVIGTNVDAISGATISSKAVAAGVNAALNAVSKLSADPVSMINVISPAGPGVPGEITAYAADTASTAADRPGDGAGKEAFGT